MQKYCSLDLGHKQQQLSRPVNHRTFDKRAPIIIKKTSFFFFFLYKCRIAAGDTRKRRDGKHLAKDLLTLRYSSPRGMLGPWLPKLRVMVLRRHTWSRWSKLWASAGSFSWPLINVTDGAAKGSHRRQERSWRLWSYRMPRIWRKMKTRMGDFADKYKS